MEAAQCTIAPVPTDPPTHAPGNVAADELTSGGPRTSEALVVPGVVEAHWPPFTISTDPARIDVDCALGMLQRTYWAGSMTREQFERAVRGSICFGIYEGPEQVGIARVITDHATHAYLSDVCVLESHRARGLAQWLMTVILDHPSLQGLRRFDLITRDAHALYAKFGFRPVAHPDRHMERIT